MGAPRALCTAGAPGIGPVTAQLRCTLPGRLGKVHLGLFQYVTLLRDALELGLQALHLVGLGIDGLALRLGHAIALRPGVQVVDAYPEPCRYFARWMTALRHLLDRCNLEFLCVPLSTYAFSLCSTLWLRSFYDSRGDSISEFPVAVQGLFSTAKSHL